MRAINHTVTGAAIGAAISNPWVALPAAFLSHFVLDMLPHYGGIDSKTRKFIYGLFVDAALSAGLLLSVFLLQPQNWQLIIACGIVGAAPDLQWMPYWLLELQGKPRKQDPVSRFLVWIQWCERPWGIYVEAVWFVSALYIFLNLTA